MVSPLVLLKPPSVLDLTDAEVMPGGAKRYLFRPPEDDAREAAEREELTRARAAYDAAQERELEVARLRNEIISEGDDGGDISVWLAAARHKAETADEKAALTAAANERMRVAALELEQIQGEVRAAHDRWLRYDESLPSAKPDARIVAQDNLRAAIAECEPLARVAEMTAPHLQRFGQIRVGTA